jgi:acetylornithine/succinyldiaminopimelate/putrescine aminotransferase
MDLRQLFLANVAQTSDYPLALEIVRAEGIYLHDASGKKYIDLISGISVSNVGHRHPKVVEAIKNQVDSYLHTLVYGEFIQAPQVQLAHALTETLATFTTKEGYTLNNVYFTNSGTEAVEGAMKLAKRVTGRHEFVVCERAYHGSTQGALSLGEESFRAAFRPLLPGIRKIKRNVIDSLSAITKETAAVIIEPIGGEVGAIPATQEFLEAVYAKCQETGTLLIFDEIQSGFGRSGTFWAFEQYGIIPDILLTAKGMGGGMPIGAFIAAEAHMSTLKNNPILGHITTFGGHPVSCAASLATLRVIQEENLLASVAHKSALFKKYLQHPKISEIRGTGLLLAAEMADFQTLKQVIDRAILKGVLTDWFLYCDNAMRIAPPLTITEEEIKEACDVILSSL